MSTLPAWLVSMIDDCRNETAADALDRLAGNLSHEIRAAMAEDPRTDPRILLRLAKDPDDYVLSRLILRPLPTEASCLLGRHERPYVRRWVAEYQYCLPALLDELARDPDPAVRCAVALKDGIPPAILATLSRDPSMPVRAAVAMRADAPRTVLRRLKADESPTVRAYALRHFCPDPLPIRWTFPDLELVAP